MESLRAHYIAEGFSCDTKPKQEVNESLGDWVAIDVLAWGGATGPFFLATEIPSRNDLSFTVHSFLQPSVFCAHSPQNIHMCWLRLLPKNLWNFTPVDRAVLWTVDTKKKKKLSNI